MAESTKETCKDLKSTAQITDCAICLETLKTPKGLPCLHTFCLKCLLEYESNDKSGGDIPCPLCRQLFTIPKEGLKSLPTNFFIQELLDKAAIDSRSKIQKLMCEICSDENDEENENSGSSATKHCV